MNLQNFASIPNLLLNSFVTIVILLATSKSTSITGSGASSTSPSVSSINNNDSDIIIYEGKRLIKVSEDSPGVLMTPEEIFNLIKNNTGFLDITNYQAHFDTVQHKGRTIETEGFTPTKPQYQTQVNKLIPLVNQTRLEQLTRNFSEFYNRFFRTKSASKAEFWLVSQVKSSLKIEKNRASVSTRFLKFSSGFFKTHTLIATITGCDEKLKEEHVIIGAHQDNVLKSTVKDVRIPGANDNAAGSVVLLEVLKIFSEMGMRFKRTIDFHWYAMKEMGRLGSLAVSEAFVGENRIVKAVLNLDSIGHKEGGGNRETNNNNNDIAIYTDNSDKGLNQFLGGLVKEYLKYGWKNKSCGFACSDHASWYLRGFRAASVGEFKTSPYKHTTNDTIETVNFEQVVEFVKLSLAYIVEVAEPYENLIRPDVCR